MYVVEGMPLMGARSGGRERFARREMAQFVGMDGRRRGLTGVGGAIGRPSQYVGASSEKAITSTNSAM